MWSRPGERMVILPTSHTPAQFRYSAHHLGTDDKTDTVVLIRLRRTASAIAGRTLIVECEAWWKRRIDPTAIGATISNFVHFASEVDSGPRWERKPWRTMLGKLSLRVPRKMSYGSTRSPTTSPLQFKPLCEVALTEGISFALRSRAEPSLSWSQREVWAMNNRWIRSPRTTLSICSTRNSLGRPARVSSGVLSRLGLIERSSGTPWKASPSSPWNKVWFWTHMEDS